MRKCECEIKKIIKKNLFTSTWWYLACVLCASHDYTFTKTKVAYFQKSMSLSAAIYVHTAITAAEVLSCWGVNTLIESASVWW